MVDNRISTLEVCGENEAKYTPEWTTSDPKLVSLNIENSEEDARVAHNFHVLQQLSEKQGENFLKDIDVFEGGFRFKPSSKLFREDTGETIYITGDENDSVRFLFYAKPEGVQPEVPFKGEDILNMERPLPITEVDRVEVVMQDSYEVDPLLLGPIRQKFPEINLWLDMIKSGRPNDRPLAFVVWEPDSLWEYYGLRQKKISLSGSTSVFGCSREGEIYASPKEYRKIFRQMGRLTKEEGELVPSDFFLKVTEKKVTGDGKDYFSGTTTLRISL
jgi:hypothetical protein